MVGTEPVTTAANNLSGSTVTYVSAGASIVMSTWTYDNLQINGAGTFVQKGDLTIGGNLQAYNSTKNAVLAADLAIGNDQILVIGTAVGGIAIAFLVAAALSYYLTRAFGLDKR